MKRLTWLMLSATVVSLLLSGCTSSAGIRIDERSNGNTVNLQVGQRLIVTLKSNPTTGYDWLVAEVDKKVVQPVSQEFQPASDPRRLGAPGQTVYEFEAVGTGATTLRLEYVRPWEKDVEPQDTFQVHITAQ